MKHKLVDIDNLPPNHPLYVYNADEPRLSLLLEIKKENKKVLGKFTTEWPNPEDFISSVCFLKSKLYAILTVSDYTKKKCKGITRQVVASSMDYNMYENTYETEGFRYHSQATFRSRKHDIFLESMTRCSMSIICQKRYWHSRNVSFPYGFIITLKCIYCKQKYTSTDKLAEHNVICRKNPYNSKDDELIKSYIHHKKNVQQCIIDSDNVMSHNE